jgi:hypothetical protein
MDMGLARLVKNKAVNPSNQDFYVGQSKTAVPESQHRMVNIFKAICYFISSANLVLRFQGC